MVQCCSTGAAFWQRNKRCAQSQSLQLVGTFVVTLYPGLSFLIL
jgi:hypothetical protein